MYDIVERLRSPEALIVQEGLVSRVALEAADEIERLQTEEVNRAIMIGGLCKEIERLRARCEAYKGQVEAGAVEIERLRACLEWRPIETAPKDGTRILLWAPGARLDIWKWIDISRWWEAGDTEWWREGIHGPTHWMPIPEPLETEKGRAPESAASQGGNGP